jgi:hypothetical protein
MFLQQFRDETLLETSAVRALVAWYYRRGPVAAAFIDRRPVFKSTGRFVLGGFALLYEAFHSSKL